MSWRCSIATLAGFFQGAAVAGGPFLIDLVAAASERGETEVAEALGVLQERDLVRPTEASRRFRFRHPFLRRAIHDAVHACGDSARTSSWPRLWRNAAGPGREGPSRGAGCAAR